MVSSLLWVVEFIIIIIIIRERIKAHEGQNWTTISLFFSKDFFSTYKKKRRKTATNSNANSSDRDSDLIGTRVLVNAL